MAIKKYFPVLLILSSKNVFSNFSHMRTLLKYRESSLYHSVSKDKHPRKYHSGEAKCLKSFIQPAYVAVLSGERDNVLVTEPLTERERESLQENGEEAFEVVRLPQFAARPPRLYSAPL